MLPKEPDAEIEISDANDIDEDEILGEIQVWIVDHRPLVVVE